MHFRFLSTYSLLLQIHNQYLKKEKKIFQFICIMTNKTKVGIYIQSHATLCNPVKDSWSKSTYETNQRSIEYTWFSRKNTSCSLEKVAPM